MQISGDLYPDCLFREGYIPLDFERDWIVKPERGKLDWETWVFRKDLRDRKDWLLQNVIVGIFRGTISEEELQAYALQIGDLDPKYLYLLSRFGAIGIEYSCLEAFPHRKYVQWRDAFASKGMSGPSQTVHEIALQCFTKEDLKRDIEGLIYRFRRKTPTFRWGI